MQNVRFDTAPVAPDTPGAAPRARGRPRGFDREAALAAATRLFWRRGYAATSLADLTAAMGIGSPSLYAAFGSKEALYAEAIRFYDTRYGPRVWTGFSGAATARAAVHALLSDSAEALAQSGEAGQPPGCMVMLSAVESEGCASLGALVRAARSEALRRIEARLTHAVEAGELPESLDRAGTARFVAALLGGLSIQARDGAGRADLLGAVRVAMAGWDGLTAAR